MKESGKHLKRDNKGPGSSGMRWHLSEWGRVRGLESATLEVLRSVEGAVYWTSDALSFLFLFFFFSYLSFTYVFV